MIRFTFVFIACMAIANPARAGFSAAGVSLQLNDVQLQRLGGGTISTVTRIPGQSLDDSAVVITTPTSFRVDGNSPGTLPDLPQAFVGAGPAPPENSFSFSPSPPGTFARGDAQGGSPYSLPGGGFGMVDRVNVIAQAALEDVYPTSGRPYPIMSAGYARLSYSAGFLVSGDSATVRFSFDYILDAILSNDVDGATLRQGFGWVNSGLLVTLSDQTSGRSYIFENPAGTSLDARLGASPGEVTLGRSGSYSSLDLVLQPGRYHVALIASVLAETRVGVVPEPSSLALCGMASIAGLGAWVRRKIATA